MPFTHGFVIGWSSGLFQAFERYEDPSNPALATYKRFKEVQTQLDNPYQLMNFPVSSMVLTSTEDQMFFITDNN